MKTNYIAFDLGASSGRAMLGTLEGGKITLHETHRFENAMVRMLGHFYWDIPRLFGEMNTGLVKCLNKSSAPASMGIDTWGVDFALLEKNGEFCGHAYAYRDPHTNGMMEAVFSHIPKSRIYELTGIQFMPINTLYQLFSLLHYRSPFLSIADKLLFIPDIFTYLFTGEKKTETTIASTSQLYNPVTKTWAGEIFRALDIPLSLMPDIAEPGSRAGMLSNSLCSELGIKLLPLTAVGTHDTASAVVSVPAQRDNWAFISSGTWSIMGVELPSPVTTPKALKFNFSNEQGVGGTTRLLKNIMGLWMVQECRRLWMPQQRYSFAELVKLAEKAPAFKSLIDPDSVEFLNPLNMVNSIRKFCQKTGQPAPETHGEIIRTILESLALRYAGVAEELKTVTGRPIEILHVVGGGVHNKLLNQFTSNATGIPVLAGPDEATAMGNVLMQAISMKHVASLEEGRKIVAASSQLDSYKPENGEEWAEARGRFVKICSRL